MRLPIAGIDLWRQSLVIWRQAQDVRERRRRAEANARPWTVSPPAFAGIRKGVRAEADDLVAALEMPVDEHDPQLLASQTSQRSGLQRC